MAKKHHDVIDTHVSVYSTSSVGAILCWVIPDFQAMQILVDFGVMRLIHREGGRDWSSAIIRRRPCTNHKTSTLLCAHSTRSRNGAGKGVTKSKLVGVFYKLAYIINRI